MDQREQEKQIVRSPTGRGAVLSDSVGEIISPTSQTPRNQFNCRLAQRYWDIKTDIPMATHYNTPIGTHSCDHLGFLCHPQDYGNYRNVPIESSLFNLDYFNLHDVHAQYQQYRTLGPQLIHQHYRPVDRCIQTPRLWNNHTKLWKFNTPR